MDSAGSSPDRGHEDSAPTSESGAEDATKGDAPAAVPDDDVRGPDASGGDASGSDAVSDGPTDDAEREEKERLERVLRRYRATLRNESATGNDGFSAEHYRSEKPPHW